MNAPDNFDATDRRQADIMALASALHEIRQTIECLHTDILNLASAQEETASRLKSLEFERNYWRQSSEFLSAQIKNATPFVPHNHSCLIPPPPMPRMGGPNPSSTMRTAMRVSVPSELVGLVIGRQYNVAKAICKSVRESSVARAWFSDVWCRMEPGKNSEGMCEILIKAKYHGVADLVATKVRERVKRAKALRTKIMEEDSNKFKFDQAALEGSCAQDESCTSTTAPTSPRDNEWTTIPRSGR